LKITLAVGIPRVERHNPEAYALFLRARDIIGRDDPEQMELALESLQRTLEIEPDYIDAEVWLALAYGFRASSAYHDGDLDLAEKFVARERAILDQAYKKAPDHARLNALLGWQAMEDGSGFVAVARYFEAALETDPRDYGALLGAQGAFQSLGDMDLAIRIGEYITSRDPMGFWGHSNLGGVYLASGNVEQAIAALKTAATISPKANSIHWKLAFALTVNGELEAALEALDQETHLPYQLHGRALALYDMGDFEGSAAAMDQLLQGAAENPDDPWHWGLARAYAWMGDADSAFRYLDTEDPTILMGEADNPYFARIKDDPRWQALTEAINREAAKLEFNPNLPPEILAIQ
jgi:tetratricopeptide (TPR) repeat protein